MIHRNPFALMGRAPYRSGFDDDARAEISKAVAIAALSALAAKAVDVVGDEVKAWLAARRNETKEGT